MSRLQLSLLSAVLALGLLAASPAQAQITASTQPPATVVLVPTPYYLPGGYSFYLPDYSRFLNYGPYPGQGFSSIQPGSPGYYGLPITPQPVPVYVPPDPYYQYYPNYPYQPMYTPRGARSNWRLDNMRPVGTPYRR